MGLEFRLRTVACRPLAFHPVRPSAAELPVELAFLREYGVGRDALLAAASEAARMRVEPVEALLGCGIVSDILFFCSLAHLLDVPFRLDLPDLAEDLDVASGLRKGRLRLADGTWVLAPSGAALRLLLAAATRPDRVPRRIAITTPAHLARLATHRGGAALARRASDALPALEPRFSAKGACSARMLVVALLVFAAGLAGFSVLPRAAALIAGLTFLSAIVFRLIVCVAGRDSDAAGALVRDDAALPRYTVLVPLHQEAGMARQILNQLAALDYPAAKLEILILVEADDTATRVAFAAETAPSFVRVVAVPPGEPRTKPRALNVGLTMAQGDLVTVFDAEDRPEPGQLRAAAARFAEAPADLVCLQVPLVIGNGARGLLPRLFALEYAGLFDCYNVGLARLGLPVALGGTSNHFRAGALRAVGGWDAWNVTEDADLGFRLARFGFRVGMLASSTKEDAPERFGVWFRQRRRWTKGWMQVALVLARDRSVWRDLGPGQVGAVALMLVGLVLGPLISPAVLLLLAWQVTAGRLAPDGLVEAGLAALYVLVPSLAVLSTLWCGYAGARARRLEVSLASLLLLVPYQLLIAFAAWGGLCDLVRRPYHWRKTPHVEVVHRD